MTGERRVGDLPAYSGDLVARHMREQHKAVVFETRDDMRPMHDALHEGLTDHKHWTVDTVVWWGDCGHAVAVSTKLWEGEQHDEVALNIARVVENHTRICVGNGVTSSHPDQGPRDDEDPEAPAIPAAEGAQSEAAP